MINQFYLWYYGSMYPGTEIPMYKKIPDENLAYQVYHNMSQIWKDKIEYEGLIPGKSEVWDHKN